MCKADTASECPSLYDVLQSNIAIVGPVRKVTAHELNVHRPVTTYCACIKEMHLKCDNILSEIYHSFPLIGRIMLDLYGKNNGNTAIKTSSEKTSLKT
jgi:hypothetical protein